MLLALQTSPLRGKSFSMQPPTTLAPLCLLTSGTSYPPLLQALIAKLDPADDDYVCEQHAAELQQILDSWTASLCATPPGPEAIHRSVSKSLRACALAPHQVTGMRDAGPLRIDRRTFSSELIVDRERFIAELASYLAPFAAIETLELEIFSIHSDSEPSKNVDTDIRYNLVGTTHDGAKEQRVGTWHIKWVTEAGGTASPWLVREWTVDPETRSSLAGPGFVEITEECLPTDSPGMKQLQSGIDDWRTALDGACGIDVYGNHGIAVGDIDGSGFDSIYVCQPSGLPNRLYCNRGDGTFYDITEASGTGILDGTASALFADFQNRGRQDLLVVRTGGVLLFESMGDARFEPRPDAFHFSRPPQGTFTSAAVADYNRDGLLDVYLCVYSYYKGLNHHQFPAPYYDAQNGPPNFLFRNRGDGTFEDVTVASGMDRNNDRFSFAAAWCDYDNSGWPSLYVANDFGRKNLYRNHGDGTFSDVAAMAAVEDYGPGMSVCWIDHDNDGRQDLYVANMWLPEGRRITADAHFLPGVDPGIRAIYQKHNAGNSFYRNLGDGTFEDHTAAAGTAKCGWSWSCAAWDFDNDGWDDLYVANGFVSGPNPYDLQSFFWRQVAQRSATAAGETPGYELGWNAVNELVRSDYSWSGDQRNVFFANNRDGSFSEVSGALGLDLIDDARAFSLSDFNHDGRLEVVLKNRTGPQLRVLRNNLKRLGHSIVFRLRGVTSNRDAIGAQVTIESGAMHQTKFVSAGSGFASQHTKELFFGLGDASGPVSISVRWPTGKVARFDGLPVNHRVQIEEGAPVFAAAPYRSQAPHNAAKLNASAVPAKSDCVATWLVAPSLPPDLHVLDAQENPHRLSALKGRPTLLTFLRADCGDSRKQLESLARDSLSLSAAGVAPFLVALSLSGDRDLAKPTASTLPIYLANERAVGPWNIQYRYLFDRRRDMASPTSFLLDASGAIVRVYRGVVEVPMVIADSKSSSVTSDQWMARAMPFPGPYYGAPMAHDYLTFGIAFSQYGYEEAAESAFLRAIDADPTHEIAWFNLGTIYLNRKMYLEARKYLSEAARLNPLDSDAWNNLGSISGMEQKYDQALDEFRHAALANPSHLNATANMMRIYQFQGRAAEAQKTLEELVAQTPGIAQLHLDLSIVLVAQNDLNRGRAELETAIKLQPNNPDAINNLGALLLRMGDSSAALAQFEQCRRIAPDFDRAVINAAVVYGREGQHDKAFQILDEFLLRHPGNEAVQAARKKVAAQ